MTKSRLKQLIEESVLEAQQQQIDAFIKEFQNFDPKHEKQRLKQLTKKLQELHRHANSEMYDNKSKNYTRAFFKLKEEIKELNNKINRYKTDKSLINVFVRNNRQYVLNKHGKIV